MNLMLNCSENDEFLVGKVHHSTDFFLLWLLVRVAISLHSRNTVIKVPNIPFDSSETSGHHLIIHVQNINTFSSKDQYV